MKRPRNRNLTFRLRDELREKLGHAAEESQRSISEEIEHRLDRSFELDERLAQALARVRDLEASSARQLDLMMKLTERLIAADPEVQARVGANMDEAIDNFRKQKQLREGGEK